MEKNKKIAWQIAALVIVVLIIFFGIRFYENGYRFSLKTFIASPGTVEMKGYDNSYQVFVDGNEKQANPDSSGTARILVSAGAHELVVNRTGYYPWEKNVVVDSGQTVHIAPFAVPASTNGAVLKKEDAKYKEAQGAISRTTVPTKESPLRSSDGSIEVYVDERSMVARVVGSSTPPEYFCNPECKSEHQIIALDAEVRGVDFYPGRNDVLLVAVQNRVFAIEIDTRGTQNFQPVYDGITPTFGVSNGALYIADAESVFTVQLTPAQ